MGSAKIKKKASSSAPASMMPRAAAIPCLVIIVVGVLGLCSLFYFALRSAG